MELAPGQDSAPGTLDYTSRYASPEQKQLVAPHTQRASDVYAWVSGRACLLPRIGGSNSS